MPLSVTQTADRQAGRKDGGRKDGQAELTDEQTNGTDKWTHGQTNETTEKTQTDGNCMVNMPDEIC